jgi:lipopolysaccharide export system protein LptA
MRAHMLFAAVLAIGTAEAQQVNGFALKNPNAPIDVKADSFGADEQSKMAIYTGNVIVRQADLSMRADLVRVAVADNKPQKIFAQGRIVVDAPSGVATGDDGVYDVGPRVVTLTGHVLLTRDKDVMSGTKLTVNLLTGVATLTGGEGNSGRVHGIFTPQTLQDQKN